MKFINFIKNNALWLNIKNISPMVRNISYFLLLTYFVFIVICKLPYGFSLYNNFTLFPELVISKFQFWRLLTYSLLHDLDNPFHLIFNLLLLILIGSKLEILWGKQRFLLFMFLTSLSGGIFVCFCNLLGALMFPVIGFSSITLGLLIAWGMSYSGKIIYFFYIIPVNVSKFVLFIIFIELLYLLSDNNISIASHFGGIIMSLILILKLFNLHKIKSLFFDNLKRLKFFIK